MKRLQPSEVRSLGVTALGLDPIVHPLTSSSAIAAALRRSASFLCPCAASTLVRTVLNPLRGLIDDEGAVKAMIEDVLDEVVAHGDLFEYRDPARGSSSPVTVLYAAPCGFVPRSSGAVILLGVSADQLTALPNDIGARVQYNGHVRRLDPLPGENLREDLLQLGLIEIPPERWLKAPANETAQAHLSCLDHSLQAVPASGEVPGLLLLDPNTPVHYYRGRWVEPKRQTGRFVARRAQAYGAPLWCYVQVANGRAEQFLDFPLPGSRWRGCDEAWRLQMAIDSQRHSPQRVRVRPGQPGTRRFELFSPMPTWAQRRWDAIGCRVEAKGCLFAIDIPNQEADEEIRYARDTLWLDADIQQDEEVAACP